MFFDRKSLSVYKKKFLYRGYSRFNSLFLILLLFFFLSGCGLPRPSLQKISSLPPEGACKIAILPFYNDSNYPLGDTLLYRVFVNEMGRMGNFELANEGDIRNIYRQMKIYPSQPLDYEQTMIVADRLGVQLIVIGHIVDMAEEKSGSFVNPILSVNLQIYDANSGRRLWTTYHGREGEQYRKVMHFGVINTISALTQQVSKEIIELWIEEGLRCTDF